MEAGLELDTLIAEKLFGWHWVNIYSEHKMIVPPIGDKMRHRGGEVKDGIPDYLPRYSTNMNDAWLITEKMKKEWPDFSISSIDNENGWSVTWGFDGYGWREVSAESAQLAICLAALEAIK